MIGLSVALGHTNMAVKIFLSVSLVFWLLIFYSDCGLRGVEASPVGKTLENRLDEIRNLYPKKTSVINKALTDYHKTNLLAVDFAELLYNGLVVTANVEANVTLGAIYPGGWVIEDIYGEVIWYGVAGDLLLKGERGDDGWLATFVVTEEVIAFEYIIGVIISRVVSNIYLLFHEYSKYRAT
jgi:hypothetical protein